MESINESASGVNLPDVQELLERAKALGINPDSLTHNRRWSDKNAVCSLKQTLTWDKETVERLYDWLTNYSLQLSHSIRATQVQQNRVGLGLMFVLNDYPKEGIKPAVTESESELMDEWMQLDATLRLLKHRERLIAPAMFLVSSGDYDLPDNDPLLMALYGLCLETAGYSTGRNRRKAEVEG